MNFNIRKASDSKYAEKREIMTIDELKELAKEFAEPEIWIYDDYVE